MSTASRQYDRSGNIIIFGIEENRNAEIWRQNVDEVLLFLLKKPADISDMFRLGRYCDNKIRPVLVKLTVAWDKRLILSKRNELKNSGLEGVFIAADEPVEIRRKQTFNRLKHNAERSGKAVSILNDVLYVDTVPTYSRSQGKISFSDPPVQNSNCVASGMDNNNNNGINNSPGHGSSAFLAAVSKPNNPEGRPSLQ